MHGGVCIARYNFDRLDILWLGYMVARVSILKIKKGKI